MASLESYFERVREDVLLDAITEVKPTLDPCHARQGVLSGVKCAREADVHKQHLAARAPTRRHSGGSSCSRLFRHSSNSKVAFLHFQEDS